MTLKTRTISIEEFKELKVGGRREGRAPSAALLAIRAMPVNSALVLSHDCTAAKPCSTIRTVVSESSNNKQGRLYSCRHLPSGELAVACFARNEVTHEIIN